MKQIQNKFLNYNYINLSFFILIAILYLNHKQRSNIQGLAVQANSIPFELRIFLNFMIFGIYLFLFFMNTYLINKKVTLIKYKLNMKRKISLATILVIVLFLPAFITSQKFQNFTDKLYGFYSIGHLKPNFVDLRAILQAMSSINSIGEIYKTACPGACIQYSWNYPQFLLDLNFIKVSELNTNFISIVLASIYLIALVIIFDNFKSIFLSFGWLMTASSFLLFERMNSEILIPSLIIINVLLIKKFPKTIYIFPVTILFLANIKFYPLMLIPVIYFMYRKSIAWLVYNLIILFIGLLMLYDDVLKIGLNAMSFGYSGTFGLKTYLGLLSGSNPSFLVNFNFSLLIFILVSGYLLWIGSRSSLVLNLNLLSDQLFIIGSILTLSSWLLSSNYQYRMASILLLIPYFSKNLSMDPKLTGAIFFGYVASAFNCAISLAPARNGLFTGSSIILIGVLVQFITKKNLLQRTRVVINKH